MASLNKVTLIGNLGKDPECRSMPSGVGVTKVSLATSEKWKDKKTGEAQVKTEWHNIVMYNKLAEIGASLLKKGMTVYIEGSISTNKWKDKDGQDRTTVSINASDMKILSSKDKVPKYEEPEPFISSSATDWIAKDKAKVTPKSAPLAWNSHDSGKDVGYEQPLEDDDLPF